MIEALPELRPAAERYWSEASGDYLPYLFIGGVLAPYVEALLAMPSSRGRDRLLRRAFRFIEEMLGGNENVVDLAFIELLENQPAWWFKQAAEFLGPRAVQELDTCTPDWRELQNDHSTTITDPYGVRQVIASELGAEGVKLDDVPCYFLRLRPR